MRSPYSEQVELLVREVNRHFVENLELLTPYTSEDVVPGDRYGIINFRSFGVDRSSRAANARTGFQPKVFQIEILLTLGCTDWIEAKVLATGCMVDLDHTIPYLKRLIEQKSWIYDFEIQGDIIQSMRQSVQPPHFWMVDITADATARMQVYRNAAGEHAIHPSLLINNAP